MPSARATTILPSSSVALRERVVRGLSRQSRCSPSDSQADPARSLASFFVGLGEGPDHGPDERALALRVVPGMKVVGDPQPLEPGTFGRTCLCDELLRAVLLAGQEVADARHGAAIPLAARRHTGRQRGGGSLGASRGSSPGTARPRSCSPAVGGSPPSSTLPPSFTLSVVSRAWNGDAGFRSGVASSSGSCMMRGTRYQRSHPGLTAGECW
jgi:hypothetical protein